MNGGWVGRGGVESEREREMGGKRGGGGRRVGSTALALEANGQRAGSLHFAENL